MKKNMGFADRVIRFIIAAVLVILYFNHTITGTWGVISLIVAAIFLLTALVNFCPIYSILGIKTCKVNKTA